ncbi:MAG: hypothetical protein EOO43_08150 [Flavobacterium sp.]|nr:MAG: hypothetical protein EOO43_08150 [Flavobacterium sp.]
MKQLTPAVNGKDHIAGNPSALIELIEYGDYECPHCGHAYPVIKHIQQFFGDKMKFVFRDFPLSKVHPHAFLAAVVVVPIHSKYSYYNLRYCALMSVCS